MRITLQQKGPDLSNLIKRSERDLSSAMRKSAGPVSRAAVKGFKSGAGVTSFAGYPLKFRAKKTTATQTSTKIEFQASPVGFWVILESGAGPHIIRPKNAGALAFGKYRVEEVHHPGCRGRGSYSKGEAAALRVIPDELEDALVEVFTRG